MNNRQVWLLRALAFAAAADLFIARVVVPVLQRKWSSSAFLPALEASAVAISILLVGGGVILVAWLARDVLRSAEPLPATRGAIYACLLLLAVGEMGALAKPGMLWLDIARHSIAVLAIVLAAGDAHLRGTTLARAAVSLAAVSLLLAAMYRILFAWAPEGVSVRWLAIGSEAAGLLLPWVVSAAVYRAQREDWIAGVIAASALVAGALVIWGVTPSIRQLLAQGIGFRFALPPLVHTMAIAAFAYFIVRVLLTKTIAPQAAWAFIWLTFSGIHMGYPQVEFGSVVALALLAWIPPDCIPESYGRMGAIGGRAMIPQEGDAGKPEV